MRTIMPLAAIVAAGLIVAPAHAQVDALCAGFGEAMRQRPEQDAVRAAPANHRVIFEDENIRVLRVTVQPGEREVLHHHRWPSVFVIDSLPKFEIYGEDGKIIKPVTPGRDPATPVIMRVPPQIGLHSIRNVDSRPFQAVRIEYKTNCQMN